MSEVKEVTRMVCGNGVMYIVCECGALVEDFIFGSVHTCACGVALTRKVVGA